MLLSETIYFFKYNEVMSFNQFSLLYTSYYLINWFILSYDEMFYSSDTILLVLN